MDEKKKVRAATPFLPRLKRVSPSLAEIERLGWAEGISFSSYGANIGIRVNDPALLDRLLDHLPPGWRPSASPVVDTLYSLFVAGSGPRPAIHLLYADHAKLAQSADLDTLFAHLESALHFNVAQKARRRLFVHAGVVGWRGRAIVIPGRSFTGKSSLVEALVRSGATYYSDEYAVLGVRGRVHPYPKPLSLRKGGGERTERCPVEAIGGSAGTEPLPIGLVVVTEYQAGARWRPRVLSPGQAVLALLSNTVLARLRSDLALTTLRRAVCGASALKSKRGEAREVAPLLLSHKAVLTG